MKNLLLKTTSILLIAVLLFSSCASTTVIQSYPSDAKLYINGEYMGNTPVTYTDKKIVASTNLVTLEKEGYYPLYTAFSRDEELDVGALIGGLFVLVPFLWIMKYKPTRTFELKSTGN